jgi:hypothetical protein
MMVEHCRKRGESTLFWHSDTSLEVGRILCTVLILVLEKFLIFKKIVQI